MNLFLLFSFSMRRRPLFHVSCGTVMYIDSHSHGSSNTMVVTGKLQDLEIMCQCVWNLEENDISTSGFCQIQDDLFLQMHFLESVLQFSQPT